MIRDNAFFFIEEVISPLSARIGLFFFSFFLQPISSGPHPSPRRQGDTAAGHVLTHLRRWTRGGRIIQHH